MPESRIPPITLLPLLIAALCIYGIILHPDYTFAGMDFMNLGYPRVKLAEQAVTAGHLPLWNWYDWGGAPLLSTLLGALAYPPTWFAMLFPLPYGLQIFVFAHLLLAGTGALYLGHKYLSLTPSASIFCAILYMGNSFFPGRIEQFQVVAVNSLLPWLILTTISTVKKNQLGLMLPAVWAATLLAGHPQFAVFNALTALTFCLIFSTHDKKPSNHLKRLIILVGGYALGTAMAAVQLAPTWELASLSERIWPYPDPTQPELSWFHLPDLVLPHYYNLISGQTGRAFGYTELGLYAGIITVPLALAGLVGGLRSSSTLKRKPLILVLAIWLIAMIFALGRNGGLATLVFEYAPFFHNSRGAARSLNIAALMLALLGGRGAMILMDLQIFKPARYRLLIPATLFILVTIDLTAQNFAAIKSVMVSRSVLNTKPLLPDNLRQSLQNTPQRIYRFMSYDSDIYLNNSAAGVAERMARIQPNLNSLSQIGLIEGYEEGLLPARSRANLFRKYNRNLRSDSPDAALLAFLNSNYMLTEFPLPLPDDIWKSVSHPFPRSNVVPMTGTLPTEYTYWKSSYNPSLVLNFTDLVSGENSARFLRQVAMDFPIESKFRFPTSTNWRHHPFENISPKVFNSASASMIASPPRRQWNSVTIETAKSTTQALLLISPQPGWKVDSKKSSQSKLKPLCSLFYMLQLPEQNIVSQSINLIYSPFSFRLGLFVSLLACSIYSQLLIFMIRSTYLENKIKRENRKI